MDDTIRGAWVQDKQVLLTHPGGPSLICDLPAEYGGGKSFCPTDLVAAALGACSLTVAGLAAERIGFDMTGTTVEVNGVMQKKPFRIVSIAVTLHLPEDLCDEERQMVERAVEHCPVRASLDPGIGVEVRYCYDVQPPAAGAAAG